jgi:large subunit ribosomal protein LP1
MPKPQTTEQREEAACAFATLILHDEGVEVTSDKISTILAAAGVEVAPFWPKIFASKLANQDLGALVLASAGSAGGAPAAGGAAAGGAAADETEAADEKEVEKSETDEEMDLDLFGGGDDGMYSKKMKSRGGDSIRDSLDLVQFDCMRACVDKLTGSLFLFCFVFCCC